MSKGIVRLIANPAIAVGLFLLVATIYDALNASLAAQLFPESPGSVWNTVVALVLALPVSFHVISVGLILQRRWLPRSLGRISFPAAVISGCWLGAALGFKIFVLN